MAAAMKRFALLWVALLLLSPDGMRAAIRKSIVSLNPPWSRIFKGENVTLICHGNNSLEDSPTKWIHNGIISDVTTSYWHIVNASIEDSGKYKCQKKKLYKSEPVYLEVFSDWLLLQASAKVVMEGEPLFIKCHGWNNLKIYKVIYYKDNTALKYMYENQNITITNATRNDTGTYYCEGRVRRLHYTSENLTITVVNAFQSKYYWLQLVIPLVVVILFAVNTGLLVSTQEQFKSILKIQENHPLSQ
uniref:Ig-like domain-containing protein n=1 Tax=Castor canadensis TaxID=51338 RepID=A0A8C0X3R0_CASCN